MEKKVFLAIVTILWSILKIFYAALDENKFMKIVYAKLLDLNDINILKLFDILGTLQNLSPSMVTLI